MNGKLKILKKPRLKNPILVAAWPGMGEVAFRAGSFMVEALKCEEFARIESGDFFYHTGSLIQDGIINTPKLPTSVFYYFRNKHGKNDLIVFLSNAQPDLSKAGGYSKLITGLAKEFRVSTVFTFAAMPLPIDHTQESQPWACATDKALLAELKKNDLNTVNEANISGMNGLFMGLAKQAGFKGISILGEIPLYTIQIANPKASLSVISAFSKITGINMDTQALVEESKKVDSEIEKLVDYLKASAPKADEPIDEEEIQQLKKSLSQHTKLPESVKIKVELLFDQAKKDITKANDLKKELDKWAAYKDYEDRFLDLFKKTKEKA